MSDINSSADQGVDNIWVAGKKQIILGVDPGLRLTGFGLIEWRSGKSRYISSGVIRIPDGALGSRLAYIFNSLRTVLERFQPTQAAIEKVFVNVNPASTLLLGHARGAAMTALATHPLEVAEYTALQIKQSVTGHGKANKVQVQDMVMRLLELESRPSADAADALACALCHAQSGPLKARSEAALAKLPAALLGRGLKIKHGRLVADGKTKGSRATP